MPDRLDDSGGGAGPADPAGPALAIVAGRPTAAETAAVVVVLSALTGQAEAAGPAAGGARPQWSARTRLLRGPVMAGPGAWRASALPR